MGGRDGVRSDGRNDVQGVMGGMGDSRVHHGQVVGGIGGSQVLEESMVGCPVHLRL